MFRLRFDIIVVIVDRSRTSIHIFFVYSFVYVVYESLLITEYYITGPTTGANSSNLRFVHESSPDSALLISST